MVAIEMATPTRTSPTVLLPYITGGRQRTMFVPLQNEPGVQMRIDKHLLHIDPIYQRKLNERQYTRYAANWSWVSCGVLHVAKRPNATHWFVFDGQHRWKAAMAVPSITDLPCIEFQLDTIRDEAIGFLAANVERRMPTIGDQFKALLIAGDPIAAAMEKLAGTYSREFGIPSDGQHISCTTAMARMMRENKAAMERVFPIVAEVAASRPITAKLLHAFHRLERCMPRGESLADDHWHQRVTRAGYDAISENIRTVALIDVKGGPRAYATGLLRAINHGLRNPLSVDVARPRR
jgi:hypothetical protein